jgi:CHRD domain
MNVVRNARALVAGIVVLSVTLSAGAEGDQKFKTRLSPVPIDTSMLDAVKGAGSATADLVGRKATISATFSGLASPATIAQLHQSPDIGLRGPVVGDLTVTKAQAGTVTGTIELKEQQVPLFRKGLFYLQVHSEKAPDGNLWGWFLPDAPRK